MDHSPALLRQIYSLRDFQLALSALDFFLEVDESEGYSYIELRRFRCYVDAAAVAYCRPFTRSPGLPMLKLEQIDVNLSDAEKALHYSVLAYRHQMVAHSDVAKMRVLLKTHPVDIGDGRVFMMPELVTDEGVAFLEDRLTWISLLRKLMRGLSRHLSSLAQANPDGLHVLQDYLRPYTD